MDVEPMVRGSTAADAEEDVSHSATAAAPAGAFVAPLSRRTTRGGRRNRRRRKPSESEPTLVPSVATGAHLAPIVTAAAVADGDVERGGDTRSGGRGRKQGKRRKKRVVAASRGAGPAASLLSPLARATAPRRHDPEGPPWSEPKWAANIRLRDEAFTNFMQIGEGTYGQVYRAEDRASGGYVALKKVMMKRETEGFPVTALREITLLKSLAHPNVVCLKEVVVSQRCDFNRMRGSVYMVFEYIEHDLTGLVESRGFELTAGHVKCYMKQLLAALTYIHSRKVPIVHRDIKGSNLLIGRDHVLKLADWGLSRTLNRKAPKLRGYATEVVTIWYRAPELLLGKPDYDGAIDVWAFGCLFAELMMGQPLLPGYTPAEQTELIWSLCGVPTATNWPLAKDETRQLLRQRRRSESAAGGSASAEAEPAPRCGAELLPHWNKYQPSREFRSDMERQLRQLDDASFELVGQVLRLNPAARPSAAELLASGYFERSPAPHELPRIEIESANEFSAALDAETERASRRRGRSDRRKQKQKRGSERGKQGGKHGGERTRKKRGSQNLKEKRGNAKRRRPTEAPPASGIGGGGGRRRRGGAAGGSASGRQRQERPALERTRGASLEREIDSALSVPRNAPRNAGHRAQRSLQQRSSEARDGATEEVGRRPSSRRFQPRGRQYSTTGADASPLQRAGGVRDARAGQPVPMSPNAVTSPLLGLRPIPMSPNLGPCPTRVGASPPPIM